MMADWKTSLQTLKEEAQEESSERKNMNDDAEEFQPLLPDFSAVNIKQEVLGNVQDVEIKDEYADGEETPMEYETQHKEEPETFRLADNTTKKLQVRKRGNSKRRQIPCPVDGCNIATYSALRHLKNNHKMTQEQALEVYYQKREKTLQKPQKVLLQCPFCPSRVQWLEHHLRYKCLKDPKFVNEARPIALQVKRYGKYNPVKQEVVEVDSSLAGTLRQPSQSSTRHHPNEPYPLPGSLRKASQPSTLCCPAQTVSFTFLYIY